MSSNPFPGLRHFEAKETHLFFGRDGQSKELLKRLQESRFLALVGVSGSGKSSLVRAGLLPALYGGLMASVESDWRIAVFRPGNNPIGNMARALITQAGFGGETGLEEVEVAVAETTLRRGNLGLLELIKQAKRKVRKDGQPFLGENENVLLVVDQFEEIFRIIEQYDELIRVKHLSEGNPDPTSITVANGQDCHPREEASAFVKLLLESTGKNKDHKYNDNLYIIVTMRSDYLGETAQFWGMPERINEGQYLIPRMTRDERRQAIVGPVAVARGSIGEPLVNQLLNDAGENPGHLPILQHALMRMWELAERSPRNGGLNLKHYDQIGKLSGALSQHANEAFDELSPELQTLAGKIFKCLTEKGLANREIRRPMTIADICSVVAANEKDVKAVVECFRKEGRWFLMPPPPVKLEPDTLIDISHESLIKGWDKLSKWVNEEAESARTYRRLADTAILKERCEEDFYRGPALQLALKWRQDNAPNPAWARRYHPEYKKAISFLDDSLTDTQNRDKAERDRVAKDLRRRRNYNIILVILMIGTVASSIFGFAAQRRALNQETARAEIEATQRLTAQAGEKEAVRLKTEAYQARQQALDAAAELEKSLEKQRDAVTAAKRAETIAIAERDKARRLQTENLEQATTYGYFKTAFDDIASRNYDQAVASLRKALTYFEEKEKKAASDSDRNEQKANRISTHINIADVYRTATGGVNDKLAVQEYNRAIELIGSNNNQILAPTLMKAGSVWKDAKNATQAGQSAEYYKKAGGVYRDLGQSTDASKAWLVAGKIHARFTDEDNIRRAAQDFGRAVTVHGGNKSLIASTSAEIGESYLKLMEEQDESEDEEIDPPGPDDSTARENAAAVQDRLRETGARFLRNSAEAYAAIGESNKAAEMHANAGRILGGSNSPRVLTGAAVSFDAAATMYGRLGNVPEQKKVLLEAGDLFVESENAFGKRLADQFYHSVITLTGTDNEEKAKVLIEIGESLGSSTDLALRQKAVEYYQQAASLYHDMNRKKEEVLALLEAANVLRDLNDYVSRVQTTLLYEQAIAVYQNDSAEQVKTLSSIGDHYRVSAQPSQKDQAVAYYRRAADLAHHAGDRRQEANSLIFAGTALRGVERTGAADEATRFFEEAVNVYQNNLPQQTATLSRIGSIYVDVEPAQKERALANYDRAILLARQHNDKASEVNAILAKARGVERLEGPTGQDKVNEIYAQASSVYKNEPAREVETLVRIGRSIMGSAREAARVTRAEQYFDSAFKLAGTQQNKKITASAHMDIGLAYQASVSQRGKSVRNYETALAIYEAEGDLYGQAMALYRLTGVTRTNVQESTNRALDLFAKVLPALQASGDQKELAEAFYAMGSLYRLKKDYQASLDSYNRALAIFTTLPDQSGRASVTTTQIRTIQRMLDRPRN